ncbi:hypothetical protein FRC08_003980 [Ceratobasidium sp. 394]|nr:hypothetical protein FRC08_003980 [Ceratobasidium sp. 394]
MSLLVSYIPEGHIGDPLLAEVVRSESCQEVIDAACEMWTHHLPPEYRVANRRLARQIQRANGVQQWVTLQAQRFVDLVRNGEEFELRLQIECFPIVSSPAGSCQHRDESASGQDTSSRDMSSTYSVNQGSRGTTNLPNNSVTEPLQPTALLLTPDSGLRVPVTDRGPASPTSPTNPTSPRSPTTPTTPISPTITFSVSRSTDPPAVFRNGTAALLAGKCTDACAHFQQAANEFHERGDVRGEADCLLQFGISCQHLKDSVPARSHLVAARTMYESLGAECRREQLQCSRYVGRIEEDTGNHQLALNTYQELIRTTDREGFTTEHAWCLCYLGHLYNQTERYDEALRVLTNVINACRETPSHEIEGFATEESGYAAERQGHPQMAMNCYERALQIFKMHGGGKWIANENRVKRRIDQLNPGSPSLGVSRRWSISTRLLSRSSSR